MRDTVPSIVLVTHTEPAPAATPLVPLARAATRLGLSELLVKDEGRLPTGSFKARGIAMAVSIAKALGVTRIAMPTNGNAGAALAADRVGHEALAVVDVPDVDLLVLGHAGGVEQVFVDGAGAFVVQFAVGDRDTVDLGLEQSAEHGLRLFLSNTEG